MVSTTDPATDTVSITDKASEKVKSLLKEKGAESGALRVFVAGGGCSG